jgi:predicted glycosyltransferase
MSGVGLRFDRETDLLELIRDADVVLGAATSVTSYAIALGKPCVFVSLLQFKDYLPYALEGAAIGVYEPDQLIPSIDRLLNDSAVRKHQQEMQSVFTKDYLGPLDGRAVRRIVDLVSELLKPRKTTQFR